MKKVFLDVGGHIGQTLEEVLKPIYLFDEVYFFEPFEGALRQASARFKDSRVKWCPFGLSNFTDSFMIYGEGMSMSAYRRTGVAETGVTGQMVCVSDFFHRFIGSDDLVVMKLNCEGSECDILNDLLDTGEIHKLANVMIDFDVRKIPEKAHEERLLLERMAIENFDRYSLVYDVMKGKTHQARIANWLRGLPFRAEISMEPAKKSFWQRIGIR